MDESGEPQRADVMQRRYLWRATYACGTVLDEVDAAGRSSPFEALDPGRLTRFALVDAAAGHEVVGFDLESGVFLVRGIRLEFGVGSVELTGRSGACYRDLVQYKSAHAEWRDGERCSGTVLDAHHIGYRAVLPEVRFEVVLRLGVRDGRVSIGARLTPAPGRSLSGSFWALVAGSRVETATEFGEALEDALALSRVPAVPEAA